MNRITLISLPIVFTVTTISLAPTTSMAKPSMQSNSLRTLEGSEWQFPGNFDFDIDSAKTSNHAPRVGGGHDALTCQWPSTTALIYDDMQVHCTGFLLAPSLVVTAAHCIDPSTTQGMAPTSVVFGENVESPARSIDIESCESHPDFAQGTLDTVDVGFCHLASPQEDLPIVPPMMGCEVDEIAPDSPVRAVGFGVDHAVIELEGATPKLTEASGQGKKRFATLQIEKFAPYLGDDKFNIFLLGDDQGVCPGDSGGPAYVQMKDGSWRVLGIAHAMHPEKIIEILGKEACKTGGLHKALWTQIPWIEKESGIDVTPCHDSDGTWNPDDRCKSFPQFPEMSESTWDQGCKDRNPVEVIENCDESDDADSSSGDDSSSPDDPSATSSDEGSVESKDTDNTEEPTNSTPSSNSENPESSEDDPDSNPNPGANETSSSGCRMGGSWPNHGVNFTLFFLWAIVGRQHLQRLVARRPSSRK